MMLLPFSVLSAQPVPLQQSHAINPYLPAWKNDSPVEGTLNIVAVIAEFQPDDNRFTSGDGTFNDGAIPYLENPGTHVDALPHDHGFFEARLEFVKNYFERLSNGALTIEYEVLPGIIQLDQQMEMYSPIGTDPTLEPLANLAGDVWTKVAEADIFNPPGFDPETTAFVIFHAGIGRDIELTGTILDKTPQDIPSIYLGSDALRRLLDDPSFEGFPIGNQGFRVSNSIISPRTLSRSGTDITGEQFVLSLSANGMLTAQIGSHLGLPDLFNTEDGNSGIGSFGLMDGAGIFAFNGLFPPELSAWEKIFLGWESAFDISTAEQSSVDLPAASLRQPNSIARINLSSDEYFLIENRHRDPEAEGVKLTIRKPDGTLTEQQFSNADTDFDNNNREFDRLLEPGIVIDVNNFDWALPGGYDTELERNLNGGILIWHIDENVIRRTINDNRVNANPGHRGVELKEADGAQDIGRPTDIGLTDNNPNGWAFDFWWNGNNASVVTQTGTITLYENRFGPDTKPSNNSHSDAPAFFELDDFSANLPVASFRVQPVSDNDMEITQVRHIILNNSFVTPDSDKLLSRYPYGLELYKTGDDQFLLLPGLDSMTALQLSGDTNNIYPFPDGNYRQPLTSEYIILSDNSDNTQITAWEWNLNENRFAQAWSQSVSPFPGLASSIDGVTIDLDHSGKKLDMSDGSLVTDSNTKVQQTADVEGYRAQISESSILLHTPGQETNFNSPFTPSDFDNRVYLSLVKTGETRVDLLIIGENRIYLQEGDNEQNRKLLVDQPGLGWPALVDIDRNGFLDILYTDPGTGALEAVNVNGAVPDFFPITPPEGVRFTGTPLAADLNGDGTLEVLVSGIHNSSLNIYAFNRRGRVVSPFPLLVGGISDINEEIVNPVLSDNSLFAVSPAGDLRQWELPLMEVPLWSSRYGNHSWNKVTGSIEGEITPDFAFGLLNKDETYNWPNPASDETRLRFQLSEPGEINIRIATMSGRQIYNRTLESTGGAPEEIFIDTSTWSSGGYYAVVTARANGRTERKMVKIGIVR